MFETLQEGFRWIESFTNLEKKPDRVKRFYRLERMSSLLEIFGHPEKDFKAIHIAGSKGKGSTAVLIASALHEAGFVTGLYTSPHIRTYKERIRINGEYLSDDHYLKSINHIYTILITGNAKKSLPGGDDPTTFELLTLLGFLIFSRFSCEWAVIETGLGGRLDATNVIQPEMAIITPIELEHTQWLGNTIEKVASEKAGIIKPGIPCVITKQKKEALTVLQSVAGSLGAEILDSSSMYRISQLNIHLHGTSAKILSLSGEPLQIHLKMIGKIQMENAVTALTALNNLLPSIPVATWLKGFEDAMLPARMQILKRDPLIITDGAHTPNSFQTAVNDFSVLQGNKESILLFGCGDDKDSETMAEIASGFSHIFITSPGFFKKSHPEITADIFSKKCSRIELIKDPVDAYLAIRKRYPHMPLLICGSFFLSAEIINYLEKTGEI